MIKTNNYSIRFTFLFLLVFSIFVIPSFDFVNSHSECKEIKHIHETNTKKQIFSPDYLVPDFNDELTKVSEYLTIEIQSNEEFDIMLISEITYKNEGNNSIFSIINVIDIETILTNGRISSFVIEDNSGPLYYEWYIISDFNFLNITLNEPIEAESLHTITIHFLLENAILSDFDTTESYVLQWSLTNYEFCEQFSLIVSLPIRYQLLNSTLIPALEPEADYVSLDQSRFEWNYYDIQEEETLTWIIRFELYNEPTNPQNIDIPAYVWILMATLFVIGGGIGSISTFFILKTKVDSKQTEIVETLLSEPEKEILKILQDEGKAVNQSRIVSISGFSKPKVSYYLNELENKKIIKRERFGRQNRVKIIDETYKHP